jgi:polysaccharide biosynthesis protein PslG
MIPHWTRFLPGQWSWSLTSVLLLTACTLIPVHQRVQPHSSSPRITKPVSFAILEDYDKGDDLADIALDFQLMQTLEIDEMRCSFGWDDYEPTRGRYDFAWLEQFVQLAADHDIKLRPYLAYTPPWAGAASSDKHEWNNPPANQQDWYNFVFALATALRDYPNVLSYEIYNEANDALWWDGSVAQYAETLRTATQAIRAADPDAEVLLGGLTYPDDDWLGALVEGGDAQFYDVTPFHAYPETWTEPGVTVENYLTGAHYQENFLWQNNQQGEAEPVWINEMGFATTPGRSEAMQAHWFARAVSTFLAEPEIEQLGLYEIKDLPIGSAFIGDEVNYHLGITRADRTPKLAFATVDLLTDLLDTGTLTIADDEATVTVSDGQAGELYHHLFVRPDGQQVLFVYDKQSSPTVTIRLATPGRQAIAYEIDGSSEPVTTFDGTTLSTVQLTAGEVRIFAILP